MPHPPKGRGGGGLGGGEVFTVGAGNVCEGDLADFFLGEVFEEFGWLHVGEFAQEQIDWLLQQRLEVIHGTEVGTVGDGRQYLVTEGVAKGVVEGLEVVHVEDGQVEGAAEAGAAGDLPPEENLLWTQYNAKTMLDAGFTSCFSAVRTYIHHPSAVV